MVLALLPDSALAAATDGTHINKYGREGTYDLKSFYAIKDR